MQAAPTESDACNNIKVPITLAPFLGTLCDLSRPYPRLRTFGCHLHNCTLATHTHTPQTWYAHATCAMHTQCTDMLHKCMFRGLSAPHPLRITFILLPEITERGDPAALFSPCLWHRAGSSQAGNVWGRGSTEMGLMPYTSSLNLYRGRLKRSGEGEAQQSTLTALEEWSHGDSSQEHYGCWESSDSLGQLHGSTSAAQRCCPLSSLPWAEAQSRK